MIFTPSFNENGILLEYPRPQFKRDSYLSLNGEWDYAIRPLSYFDGKFTGKITVPYSPESELSGVSRALKKNEALWLKKCFSVPKKFNRSKIFLNIGACDQICEVYLNGKKVGYHEGGYLSFSVDLSDYIKENNELIIKVTDNADSDIFGRGKQRYKRGGIWYTATSGIWQSIWLESVPTLFVKSLYLTPLYAERKLKVKVVTSAPAIANVEIIGDSGEVIARGGTNEDGETVLDASKCKDWSVDDPQLYKVLITLGGDKVESYFGMRSFSRVEIDGKHYFTLNNKPIFHNGLLDQGYFHDGIYTPSSNKVMYDEVKAVKDLGFNMLRKHIKVEPMLWYYYCDILGVLVWQDMINGGSKYNPLRIMLAPFFNLNLNDHNYRAMGRSEQSRRQYFIEAEGMMDQLYNCVSLCLYTPFNEAWGQFDAKEVTEKLREKDPTRLYDHASGWQDKGGGDLCSKHIYFRPVKMKNDNKRILALTEFGGYSMKVEGHIFSKKDFGYKKFKSAEKLNEAYENLYKNEIIPLIPEGLCATVYTQLTDVEDEVNGLYTYDRVLKFDGEKIKKINEALYEQFNKQFN